uniref:Uncharacterized protein n=1 Tax=Rhizophora mucronata TaxID=61149 RepID=A0A2P2PKP1_RHIMU
MHLKTNSHLNLLSEGLKQMQIELLGVNM